jgi:coenzyme PQQ precursor peptide PqqA
MFSFGTPALAAAASILAGTSNGTDIAYPYLTARIMGLVEPQAHAIGTSKSILFLRRSMMAWSKPEFIDWRFGFEITLYIAKR